MVFGTNQICNITDDDKKMFNKLRKQKKIYAIDNYPYLYSNKYKNILCALKVDLCENKFKPNFIPNTLKNISLTFSDVDDATFKINKNTINLILNYLTSSIKIVDVNIFNLNTINSNYSNKLQILDINFPNFYKKIKLPVNIIFIIKDIYGALKINEQTIVPLTGIFFCKNYGREFKTLNGVTRHEKKCDK